MLYTLKQVEYYVLDTTASRILRAVHPTASTILYAVHFKVFLYKYILRIKNYNIKIKCTQNCQMQKIMLLNVLSQML